jgi:hypothetical protein
MKTNEVEVGKMEAQLKQWGVKLDDLVAKADQAGTEAKADYRKHIDDLRAKYQAAESKLDELKAASTDKKDTIKHGFESAWSEVEVAFKKLTS